MIASPSKYTSYKFRRCRPPRPPGQCPGRSRLGGSHKLSDGLFQRGDTFKIRVTIERASDILAICARRFVKKKIVLNAASWVNPGRELNEMGRSGNFARMSLKRVEYKASNEVLGRPFTLKIRTECSIITSGNLGEVGKNQCNTNTRLKKNYHYC